MESLKLALSILESRFDVY